MNTTRLLALLMLFAPIALGVQECPDETGDVPSGPEDTDLGDGDSGSELTGLAGECAPVAWLTCGEVVSADTADVNSGTTTVIDGYPVAVGNYSGPELAYALRPTHDETVTWKLVDPDPTTLNHDLFVLESGDGTCAAEHAVQRGFNDVSFEVEAGKTYFLLVDGFDGAAGSFSAELECTGSEEGDDLPEPPQATAEVIMSPQPYESSHLARTAELIDGAQVSIDVAMYSFRDNGVLDAIGRARERGVSVRAILESAHHDKNDPEGTKSAQLEEMGAEVRWVNKIMHHKFVIIDGPRTDAAQAAEATLITGSGNWSYGAGTKFDENTVIVRGDQRLILAFQQEYELLWDNGRLLEWNEDIAAVETIEITDAMIDDATGSEAVFTSENMTTYTSSHGPTFRTVSGSGAVRDEIAHLIDGAQDSIWIASGHLRSRQITDALLHAWQSNPDLDIQVYLDGQEYVSDGYHDGEVEDYAECMEEASTDTQRNNCLDDGLHFGWMLNEAGIDLRYKYYAYRWHYSYAPQMHHKYLIVDGGLVAAGSYNFSNNAEHNTVENLVIYDGASYPQLVDDFEANFSAIWNTGLDGAHDELMAQITSGASFPIVFESMALAHDEVSALKAAIYEACPDINSDDYKSHPQSHQVCEK